MQDSSTPSLQQQIDTQIQEGIKLHTNSPLQTLALANAALESSREIGYYSGIAQALRVRALALGVRNEIVLSEEDFRSALQWSQQLGDRLLEARCHQGLSAIYRVQSNYRRALEEYYVAVELFQETGNAVGEILCNSGIGTIYGEIGDYPTATDYLLRALRLSQETNNSRQTAYLLDTLGQVYGECGETEKAIATLSEGVAIAEENNNLFVLCSLSINYANNLAYMGRFSEALPFAERALNLANEIGSSARQILGFISIAEICLGMNNPQEAEAILDEALVWSSQTKQMPANKTILLIILARTKLALNQWDTALTHLTAAQSIAQEHHLQKEIAEAHKTFSDLYEAQGDYRSALEQQRLYHTAYVALQKESARNQLLAKVARQEAEQAHAEARKERERNAELLAVAAQQEDMLAKLKELALRDPLTGAFNRRHADEILHREMDQIVERGSRFSIVLGDIDNFKNINDTFSHGAGDLVLRTTAMLLHSLLAEKEAILARFGGEEWLVILPNTSLEEAANWAETARATINKYDWSRVVPELGVTISFGVAEVWQDKTETRETLLARADERLYTAKRTGKNRVVTC